MGEREGDDGGRRDGQEQIEVSRHHQLEMGTDG